MKRLRLTIGIVFTVLLLSVVGYLGAGFVVYNTVAAVDARCEGRFAAPFAGQTPDNFTGDYPPELDQDEFDFDSTSYLMSEYETVSFPARGDDDIEISGFYVPARENPDSAPVVIAVHGRASCKNTSSVLIIGGMLARNNFNVLMIDLRDHGASTVDDGYFTAGITERWDVLGAWDWLQAERGFTPGQIGVHGHSLGGATALLAMYSEPELAAVFADGSYYDLRATIDTELDRFGVPRFLGGSGILVGRLISGVDITEVSPSDLIPVLDGRALYLTHGLADTRINPNDLELFREATLAAGEVVPIWPAPDMEHMQAMHALADEYEQRMVEFFNTALRDQA